MITICTSANADPVSVDGIKRQLHEIRLYVIRQALLNSSEEVFCRISEFAGPYVYFINIGVDKVLVLMTQESYDILGVPLDVKRLPELTVPTLREMDISGFEKRYDFL
ncbi:hypothetical protein GF380_03490 [Candidatus Uhrbacteria bacterium]|nr:hypothetical protein [Candidatus Uhrbacteria bacterium]